MESVGIIIEFYVIVDNLMEPQYSEACAGPNSLSGRYISARFQTHDCGRRAWSGNQLFNLLILIPIRDL